MGNLDRRDFARAAAMGLAAALHEFGWNLAQAAEEAGPMPIRTDGIPQPQRLPCQDL